VLLHRTAARLTPMPVRTTIPHLPIAVPPAPAATGNDFLCHRTPRSCQPSLSDAPPAARQSEAEARSRGQFRDQRRRGIELRPRTQPVGGQFGQNSGADPALRPQDRHDPAGWRQLPA
jgi:hypothetical protein